MDPPRLGSPGWLTASALKRRGWKWEIIWLLLGPGRRIPNPFGEEPIRMYQLELVQEAEAAPSFQLANLHASDHYAPSQEDLQQPWAVQERGLRRQAAWLSILQGEFTIPMMSNAELRELSLAYCHAKGYPAHRANRPSQELNTLRHNASLYDVAVKGTSSEERGRLLQVILSACAIAYPHLRKACRRKLEMSAPDLGLLLPSQLPGACGEQARATEQHRRMQRSADRRANEAAQGRPDPSTHLSTKQLKRRGWSKAQIRQLLPQPASWQQGSGCSPMKCWHIEDVERAERSISFDADP